MDEREMTMEEIKKHEKILKGLMSIKRVLVVQKTMTAVYKIATVADVERLNDKNNFTHGGYMKGGKGLWQEFAQNANM